MGRFIDPEERRYQRRLIPLNIVMAIIALVATISLLFAPLLVIDMSKAMEGMPQNGTEQGSSSGADKATNDLIAECLDFKLSISTMTFGQLGFASEDKQLEAFVESLFPDDVIEHLMVSAVNLGVAMSAEILEEEGYDLDKLTEEFKKIDGVKNEEEFKTVMDGYIGVIETQVGDEFSDEMKDELSSMLVDMYKDTIKEVGADNFSLEAFVCVSFVNIVNENREEGAPAIPVVTEYNDLFVGILDGTVAMPGSNGDTSAMDAVKDLFEMAGNYFKIVFAVLAFFALIWFILFLFAFIRIFTKNKRFTMWYAKLLGGIPCLIFGVAPLLAGLILGSSLGAEVVALLGAISTFTWISGVCYLLMWLFSIFWAFPIKRKIRKIRKGEPV